MSEFSPKSYTFNHPLAALLTLPLILLGVMLVSGLTREFNFVGLFVLIFNAFLLISIAWFSFLRRLKFTKDQVEWITPRVKRSLSKNEIKQYGVVKYRAFRFIYLSRSEQEPFDIENPNLTPNENTFVFQYRKGGWATVTEWLKGNPTAKRQDMHFRN